ncbi:glucuronyl hydrolase [Massilia dura]|uniref:Glucuronyl hydrolase n=1 Tax=Pseudoduganella dura TaxID=321982 RepID=A0A6I3XVR2_9BURK|nr:glycoside hydrolase family 88 protein [Pseudoduganella dura]MUI16588.1 glucuronyl hydrolase [Pseudoduganella dura]
MISTTLEIPARGAVFDEALALALRQLAANLERFAERFPDDTTAGNHYTLRRYEHHEPGVNAGWTSGFWTGMLWIAHELTGNPAFGQAAARQLPSFAWRLAERIQVDHHDLGFLYTPSAIAEWRNTGDSRAHRIALQAADCLMARYLPGAGIIQAWGDLDDPAQRGRIIIDCLMNLPLLHWASTQSGEQHYRDAALSHLRQSRDHLVRPDHSSFHTFHFDPVSGAPLRGSTAQGRSDDSCWARGQAWGIYGFALNHRHAPDLGLLDVARGQADYFLARLPPHGVAYWDLAYGDGSGEPWDSSASAIAACGLLELASLMPPGAEGARDRAHYHSAALHILEGLARRCAASPPHSDALLLHGVYSKPHGQGVDEANLWGDFFYLEALARVARGWTSYW